jgi:small subunit ribosomal protein S16
LTLKAKSYNLKANMLMIRLQRRGKKHQAHYRLVVGEKRSKLLGKQTEDLGWYNPHENKYDFQKERIQYWLKNGAKTSTVVHNLLVSAGIIAGKKLPKHKIAKKTEAASPAA